VADHALSQIMAIQRTPGVPLPRPAQCQIVTRIASHGVAARAGVARKDFLATVDGQPAARVGSRLYLANAPQRSYTFYSRPRHERLELVATGIEIGVLLEPTTPAVRASYKPGELDPSALEILWAGRDFEALEQLTAKTLARGEHRASPALLFHGAALYESGRLDAGFGEVREYLLEYAQKWTMNFSGIARYYSALEARRRGNEADVASALRSAWECNPSDRMAELIESQTGARPLKPPSRWLQRRFPEYAYPSFEVHQPCTVTLAGALEAMHNDQLLAVCLLASYRSNGPYADFLMRWRNYATHLREFFWGLHVLTSRKERYPGREYHYEREAEVRALGLPFHLLHEHDEAVAGAILPPGSPTIFLLDRTGTVVYEGPLDSVDVWDALASVSA
jgi:hypothetical protein